MKFEVVSPRKPLQFPPLTMTITFVTPFDVAKFLFGLNLSNYNIVHTVSNEKFSEKFTSRFMDQFKERSGDSDTGEFWNVLYDYMKDLGYIHE